MTCLPSIPPEGATIHHPSLLKKVEPHGIGQAMLLKPSIKGMLLLKVHCLGRGGKFFLAILIGSFFFPALPSAFPSAAAAASLAAIAGKAGAEGEGDNYFLEPK